MNTTLWNLVAADANAGAVRLQLEVCARLEADAYFSDITVMESQRGELDNNAQTILSGLAPKAGKRGAAVVVLEPDADDECPNVQGGPLRYRVDIDVMELVSVNRDTTNGGTGKVGAAIAARVVDVLKLWESVGIASAIEPEQKECIRMLVENSVCTVRRVRLSATEADDTVVTRLQRPVITRGTGVVTMSAADAGAAIWYTLDGTQPSPANGTLYTVAVAVTAGMVVRTCAYKSACIASDVNRLVF